MFRLPKSFGCARKRATRRASSAHNFGFAISWDDKKTLMYSQKRRKPLLWYTFSMEGAAQKKILIVEDEPLLGNLLKQRLDREGFAVTLVRDGEEAFRTIQGILIPDLVLLDIILPKISGFELMERINQDPDLAQKHIPIVIVSNLGQEGDVKKGQDLGAIGYFVKAQLSIEDLVSRVREFFGQ